MNNLKEIIEKKKQKSNRKPRYGTRKLSIGLVSCVLGYTMLVSPSISLADEANSPAEIVVVEESESTDGVDESETTDDEKTSDVENSEKEHTEEVQNVENAKNGAEDVAPAKEVQKTPSKDEAKEEPASKKEENSEEAPAEEAEKKLVTLDEYKKLQEENVEDTTDSNTLEISEQPNLQALRADETAEDAREPKDISNEVQNKYVALTEEGHETKGTVKPDAGEAIGWEVFFTSPKGTIAGDYFTIDLSENLSLKGIEPDHENEYPIEIDGKVVADGVRTDRSTIKYTFNENINDQRHVVVSVKGFAYIDKTKVPNNTPDEKISIALGDKVDEHTINVEYGDTYYTGNNLNGISQFTEFNPETGEYTQVFYINPDSKTITTSNRNWATGKVAMFIDGITPDGSPSDVNYTEKDTTVSIQKLPKGTDVPSAIIENPVETDEETMVKTVFRDGGIEITFADNGDQKLRHNNIDSPYIVTVKSTAAPSKTGNNVYSRATLYGDGTKFHIMDNSIVTTVGDTEAQGDKIGYFKEHHVYYTKVDGVLQEDKTFTLHSNKTEGYDYDTYFTNKNEIDDFKFVRVDTDNLVEKPVYNKDGAIARGNYEPGKTKEVTYIYVRDIKHGSFQEHHIYQTLDEDGNIIDEKTVTKEGKETTGIDENEYSTSKKDQEGNVVTEEIDKDGYKLVEVKATNDKSNELGVQFDGQGAATSGNYVNGEKLEVTYTYQKKVTTKGNFIEHHIYQTVDEDDKVISTDDTVNKEATTGKETEKYTTAKEDRDGYKLTKVEGKENAKFNEDGSKAEGNYVKGKTQEVTYTYQKKVTTKGNFIEHHIYQTVDEDNKVISTDDTVNKEATTGKETEKYTTAKEDRDGYKLTKVEGKENAKFNEDGSKAEGNYVKGKTQEVTYTYQKKVTTKGNFIEHHIYQTVDEDGKVISTDDKLKKDSESTGKETEEFTTQKKDEEGYNLVKVEGTEGTNFNQEGTAQKTNYKKGETQEVTYTYQKKEITKGTFKEHHIYQTVDENGKVISTDDKLKKDSESTGKETEEFTTQKKDEEGYTLVKVEGTEGTNFNQEGTAQKTNYKKGETQEVTYTYQKNVTTKGTFQEHHIYITKDQDGEETSKVTEDGKLQEGKKEETYTTSKVEKDGFTLVRTENPVEEPTFNKDGSEATGNFKPGVKQEITYVYEKTVKSEKPSEPTTPTTPSEPEETTVPSNPDEPTVPSTPDEPTVPSTPEEPTVPSTPEEPTVPSTPEEPTVPSTPEEPEDTTPLIPLTPADPIDKAREVIEREENNRNEVKVPGHKKSDNPKTGIASSLGVMGTLAASALAFLGLDDKKRKNK